MSGAWTAGHARPAALSTASDTGPRGRRPVYMLRDVHPDRLPRAAPRLAGGRVLRCDRQQRVGGAQHRAPILGGQGRVHLGREPLAFAAVAFEPIRASRIQSCRDVVHCTRSGVQSSRASRWARSNGGGCFGKMAVGGRLSASCISWAICWQARDALVGKAALVQLFQTRKRRRRLAGSEISSHFVEHAIGVLVAQLD